MRMKLLMNLYILQLLLKNKRYLTCDVPVGHRNKWPPHTRIERIPCLIKNPTYM